MKWVQTVSAWAPVAAHNPTATSATPPGMVTTLGSRLPTRIPNGAPAMVASVSGPARSPVSKAL
ncbi:Uncharacterised protein [Mycobacteroides abscessus subsp. bolletii]|nr:Uncharacterised protein [Mycobacteroides abscessus subsp. bolletii]